MNFAQYTDEVKRTVSELDTPLASQIHMAIGLSTEANEVLDAYKKSFAYGKKLDVVNVGEELGDMLWYMANLMRMLNISFEDVLQINVDKLKARYPDKFDSQKAMVRDLEKERAILNKLGFDSTPE
jgi:NTP pyrophosphatase (non-canonical NTP hydrolase)